MIYCETEGEGIPIFLLHGIGSNSRSWRRQIASFSAGFKVVAWDAPGFGRSEDPAALSNPSMRTYANSLRELMDSLGAESSYVLGHSLGGIIAQEFYRACPDRVRGLILADTTQGGMAEPPDLRESKLNNRLRMIRTMTPEQLARDRAPTLLSREAPTDLVSEVAAIMAQVRPVGYEYAARAMAGSDTRGVLDKIKVPLLMIWGAEDKTTPVWETFPEGAKVRIIPGAGHLCFMEQADVFNAIVLEFLNG